MQYSCLCKVRQAAVPVHPDAKGTPDNVLFRNEAPVTAIVGIIPVVAHHEIVTRRHGHFTHLRPRGIRIVEDMMFNALEMLLVKRLGIVFATAVIQQILLDWLSVDIELPDNEYDRPEHQSRA